MAASVVWKLLSDGSTPANPHLLTPYILYRGMTVYVEYHELYMKNVGSVLNNPTHALSYAAGTSGNSADGWGRRITGSAKNASGQGGDDSGDNSATDLIAWEVTSWWGGMTAFSPSTLGATWPANRIIEIYTKYKIVNTIITPGTSTARHSVGGNEP